MPEIYHESSVQTVLGKNPHTVEDVLFNLSEYGDIDFSKFPSLRIIFSEEYKEENSEKTVDCKFTVDVDPEIVPMLRAVLTNAIATNRTIAKSKIKYSEVLNMHFSAFTCAQERFPSESKSDLYTLTFEIPGLYSAYEKANQSEVLGQ